MEKGKYDYGGKACQGHLSSIDDALYAIGGKWKLRVIAALRDGGNLRFNELQRMLNGISARVLSNELKEMELNDFVKRTVYTETPVVIEYSLTAYSESLGEVLIALSQWGAKHKDKIRKDSKAGQAQLTTQHEG